MDEFFDKIKDSANKAKDSAEKLAKEVAKRTSNAITHTKLTFSVNETQSKVRDVYSEIGKTLYTKHLEGEHCDEDFADSFEQLDKLMEEIEMLNNKIADLKNSLRCPECGALNHNEAEFCSKCGTHITKKDDGFDINIGDSKEYEPAPDNEPTEPENTTAVADDDDEDVIVINPKKPE